jgi:hypothetical protein
MMRESEASPVPCCVCGAPRPQLAIDAHDEFCSTECCQAAHGVPVVASSGSARERSMNTTVIEWTDRTLNPVRGCTKVSPGWDRQAVLRGSTTPVQGALEGRRP